MELTITDAGRHITVQLHEGEDTPVPIVVEKASHLQFFDWWARQCHDRNIPYQGTGSAGYKIIKRLLKQYTYTQLQKIATRFMLDHGEALRSEGNHFVTFTHMIPIVVEEMKQE